MSPANALVLGILIGALLMLNGLAPAMVAEWVAVNKQQRASGKRERPIKGSTMSQRREGYEAPAIIYENDLEVQAGSPGGLYDDGLLPDSVLPTADPWWDGDDYEWEE